MTTPQPQLLELGQAALNYGALGYHVFPLRPGTKVSLISKKMGGNGNPGALGSATWAGMSEVKERARLESTKKYNRRAISETVN